MPEINFAADAVIYVGSIWILLTSKVQTRTGSSLALAVIGLSSLGNLVTGSPCYGATETMMKAGVASLVVYAFWRIEVRNWLVKRLA